MRMHASVGRLQLAMLTAVVSVIATALVVVAPAARASGPTLVSGTISTNTTWTLANSPYVLTGSVTVASSATLTIEPGVVVRFRKPSSSGYYLHVNGVLYAVGTPSSRIVFTSDRDATYGGTGSAARGDWIAVDFPNPPTGTSSGATSVMSYTTFRYGGFTGVSSACSSSSFGGEVYVSSDRRAKIDHAVFEESFSGGLYAPSRTDATAVDVSYSSFRSSCDGIWNPGAMTVRFNDFESTLSRSSLYFNAVDAGWVVLMNRLAAPLRASEYTASTANQWRFNDILAGVVSSFPPKDLAWNWWGAVLTPPPFCVTSSMTNLPPYQFSTVPTSQCASGKLLTSYKNGSGDALSDSGFDPFGLLGGGLQWFDLLGGGNPATRARPCGENVVHPVECSSGNFWHHFDGLSIPGRGVPLDFNFTFNSSAAATDIGLGYGWTHSYGMRITTASTTATVHQENGAQVPFTSSGSTWTAPSRYNATLTGSSSSGWTFVRNDREELTFDMSGRLTAIRDLTDPSSYVTTLTYPTSTSMVVTDVAGRTLTFATAGGRITGVTDSSSPGRSMSFSYNSAGEMTGFTDARAGTWAFEYESSGSHRLTTMRKPNEAGLTTPPKLVNTYDIQGRVTTQTDWLNRTTTFEYDTVPGSSLTTTLVTDPRGNKDMKVFAQGVLVSSTKGYGTAAALTWNYSIDPVTLGVARAVDPAGKPTTMTYDTDGNLLTKIDELGRQSSWTYDALGNVLTDCAEPLHDGAVVRHDRPHLRHCWPAHVRHSTAVHGPVHLRRPDHDLHAR